MKRGMIRLKKQAKRILADNDKISVTELAERLNISRQMAGVILRKLGWEMVVTYEDCRNRVTGKAEEHGLDLEDGVQFVRNTGGIKS